MLDSLGVEEGSLPAQAAASKARAMPAIVSRVRTEGTTKHLFGLFRKGNETKTPTVLFLSLSHDRFRSLRGTSTDNHVMWKLSLPGVVLAIVLVACAPATSEPPAPTSTTSSTTAGTADGATTAGGGEAQSGDTGSSTESDPGAAFDETGLSLGPGQAFTVLDDPPMVPASSASWLKDDDVVLGIVGDGEAHAFPAAQLAYHHIVNTTIAGEPYLVTY